MGWLGRLLGTENVPVPFDTYGPAQVVLPDPYEPFYGYYGGGIAVADPGVPLAELGRQGVEAMWRTQPNVRKVVDFIARNIASIPLHTYDRVSDTDRRRVHDGPLAATVTRPSEQVSPYRFWHAVLSDGLLYDRWAVLRVPREDGSDGEDLVHLPSWRIRFQTDALRRLVAVWYWTADGEVVPTDDQGWKRLDLDMLVWDYGYAPRSAGVSPLETLADILSETTEAVRYRQQVWQNGARVPAWIERPPPSGGADWSPAARERFKSSFRAAYTGTGPQSGGVPLLEDGMKLHEFKAFSPQDLADLEGRRLSAIEVAAAYHIAPELVGAREGTYSNVDAFRQMLYRDSLGPYITAWEGAVNTRLTPALGGPRMYVEAHVDAKLRGSFVEQGQVMQSATGAPWMTRNEARAMRNMPPVSGGDELVVPLNVLTGGQASPQDSGSQNLNARQSGVKALKAAAQENHAAKLREVLTAFFARQGKSVLSALGAGSDSWWDAERWDGELADDLQRVTHTLSTLMGKAEAERLGYPDAFDPDRTVAFLRAVAERKASSINETTRLQVALALEDDEANPADVFTQAKDTRAEGIGDGLAVWVAGFATLEAAKHIATDQGVEPTKTWITGANPRPDHAAVNGETVGIRETFSNGMDWPGDGGPDDVGCNCSVAIDLP